jgi:hypothetical protein
LLIKIKHGIFMFKNTRIYVMAKTRTYVNRIFFSINKSIISRGLAGRPSDKIQRPI